MATERKTFHCLRCQHRFLVDYDKNAVVERACPKCGSNSVRLPKPVDERLTSGRD